MADTERRKEREKKKKNEQRGEEGAGIKKDCVCVSA